MQLPFKSFLKYVWNELCAALFVLGIYLSAIVVMFSALAWLKLVRQ